MAMFQKTLESVLKDSEVDELSNKLCTIDSNDTNYYLSKVKETL
jgi:hypothetical protein